MIARFRCLTPSFLCLALHHLAAPSKAVIYAGNEPVKRDKGVGPLSENSVLALKCTVLGGKPAPKLVWRQIDSKGKAHVLGAEFLKSVSTEDRNDTSLELKKKLSRSDLNAKYECHVDHEALGEGEADRLDARIEVDLNGKTLRRNARRGCACRGEVRLGS